MSTCDDLAAQASAGAAPALRAVDCLANDAAASAFGRLFGPGGAMLYPLTILLTLYIAFFAISLLTGRSRLGISALTPRMMTLGLVLTFATSWAAYQGVVWNLAIGAPDQLAGVLTGAPGSATQIFADKLDVVFAAIAQAADMANAGGGEPHGAGQASFSPQNLMWLAALLLLLGTVGVLVTARIALAVLLAIGPVFVVMALFAPTRGLFAGWLRGAVMTAVTPLFVVVGGSLMLELLVPVLAALAGEGGINGQAAMALFLIAAIHMALMVMVLKVSGTIVSSWRVFEPRERDEGEAPRVEVPLPHPQMLLAIGAGGPQAAPRRTLGVAPAQAETARSEAPSGDGAGRHSHSRTVIAPSDTSLPSGRPAAPARRAQGIGSRFSTRPTGQNGRTREMMR